MATARRISKPRTTATLTTTALSKLDTAHNQNFGTFIPVTLGKIGGHSLLVVNARQLHKQLGVTRDFSKWAKQRFAEYDFVCGHDYVELDPPILSDQVQHNQVDWPKMADQSHGGNRRSMNYILTLTTAKEITMVESSPRGKMVRKYFIECEKEWAKKQSAVQAEKVKSEKLLMPVEEHLRFARCVGIAFTEAKPIAFEEYARVLVIVGEGKAEIALKVASAAFDKKSREILERIYLKPPEKKGA